jgi:lipoprotein-anchoring transpeptidase ErfK/SrfK
VSNAARRTIPVLLALVAAITAVAAGAPSPALERTREAEPADLVRRPQPTEFPSEARADTIRITRDRHLLVLLERTMRATRRPGSGRAVGMVPARSPYYGIATRAWVLRVSHDGRFGLVPVPYAGEAVTGWLRLRGLRTSTTRISVHADLSAHRLSIRRGDRVILSAPAATGAASTPTPTGRYVVSDRVPFSAGSVYGTFAFGLSGIQTHLPAGWTGGNQLAIHGTNDPSSIGRSASYGCLRVSERVLDRLRPLLRLGTPVTIRP